MATQEQDKPEGPVDRLKHEAGGLAGALAERAMSSVRDRVEGATHRLTDYAEGDHGPGLIAAATGARHLAEGDSPAKSLFSAGFAGIKEKVSGMFGKGKGKGGSKKLKLINIIESIDVGVPVRLAYDQWNEFNSFPSFMKKLESAERVEDTKLNWKAQIFWSHRTWESTIVDQRPDERIVWRSKGQKGHVDGAVSFHELSPNLTRIVLVLEYHPQGLFERTGNLWRAQGRRARLELKHFARHVMTNTVLHPDDIEGWRGTIEDSEVVVEHEQAMDEEARERDEAQEQEPTDEAGEADDQEPADEADEDQEPADEADDEADASETSSRSRSRRTRRPASDSRDSGDEAAAEDEDEDGEAPEASAEGSDAEAADSEASDGSKSGRKRAPARPGRTRRAAGDQPQRRTRSAARGGGNS